jgi:hypothetical protein
LACGAAATAAARDAATRASSIATTGRGGARVAASAAPAAEPGPTAGSLAGFSALAVDTFVVAEADQLATSGEQKRRSEQRHDTRKPCHSK